MSILFIGKQSPDATKTGPDTLIIDEPGSLGIDKSREVKHFLSIKPQGDQKLVVIKHAENLTEEAQNALLKILEEPPLNCIIHLEAKSEDQILPTIRSRCQIVYGKQELKNPSKESLELVDQLPKLTIPQRLAKAKANSQKRDQALDLVDDLLVASEVSMEPKNIRALFKAKRMLKANTNTRLVLENLFLNW